MPSEPLDPRLREERVRAAHVKANILSKEKANVGEGRDPWPSYAQSTEAYLLSFGKAFPDILQLPERMEERHARGIRTTLLDVCGVARGEHLHVDHSIGVTLTNPGDNTPAHPDQTIIVGDLFQSGTLSKIIQASRSRSQEGIHVVFMRPVGGLGGLGLHMRAHLKLYSLFQRLYEELAPDGEMYIDLLDFDGAALIAKAINRQCTPGDEICRVQVTIDKNSISHTLIQIRKTPSAPRQLYTVDQLRSIPGLESSFRYLLSYDR